MDELTARVRQFVRRNRLLRRGERVLVGFSGGPDSVALALILRELSSSDALPVSIVLAHMNHCLRGAESDADEEFCRRFAGRHALEIHAARVDVRSSAQRGESLEQAARRLRYQFLTDAATARGIRTVAVGHHADDVAETVLMRLLRGCGLRGLAAIAPARPSGRPGICIVRPLLEIRKAELLALLARLDEAHRLDSSNLDRRFLRNRIRQELLPALEARRGANLTRLLAALNAAALETNEALDEALSRLWADLRPRTGPGWITLDAAAYARMSPPLRKLAVRRALEVLSADPAFLPGLARRHYDAAAALAEREVGTALTLPGGFFVRREHGLVMIQSCHGRPDEMCHGWLVQPCTQTEHGPAAGGASRGARGNLSVELPVPGSVSLGELALLLTAEVIPMPSDGPASLLRKASGQNAFLSLDALSLPLKVRPRRAGDRFRPLGAPGSRKLKDFFIDHKVPRHTRDRVPVVVDARGRIAWVVGHTIAEPFKLTGGEARVLHLRAVQRTRG